MPDKPPQLCLTIMAWDAEREIRRVLNSMGFNTKNPVADELIVAIDDRTEDKTREVVKELGGTTFDFTFEDDFAKVRNQLWRRAKATGTKWIMWLDADDVIVEPQKILTLFIEIIHNERKDLHAVQMPYFYAQDEELGGWSVYHDRVRIVRADVESYWENRVHEVLRIPSCEGADGRFMEEAGGAVKVHDIYVEHYKPQTSRERDPDRNLRILQAQLDDTKAAGEPVDARTLYHLALEALSRGQWSNAIYFFKEYIPRSGFREEIYDALCELGVCYRQIAQTSKDKGLPAEQYIHEAADAYMKAIRIFDDHPDAWYGLASAKFMEGNGEAALRFLDRGDEHRSNPMRPVVGVMTGRITLDPAVTRLNCYQLLGRIDDGLQFAEEAKKLFPGSKQVEQICDDLEEWKAREDKARGILRLAEDATDVQLVALADIADEDVWAGTPVRDVLMPAVVAKAQITDAMSRGRVVFVCGEGLEAWGPPKLDDGGLGGSETAVVNMAKAMKGQGYEVEVYNFAGKYEGVHDGVLYANVRRYDSKRPALLTVASRMPNLSRIREEYETEQFWLWCHDLHYDGEIKEGNQLEGFDRVMPVSDWHAIDFGRRYPWIPKERIRPTRNGIDLSRFDNPDIERQRRRCVYMSSPDRGLDHLLLMWPMIYSAFDDAELHIYYGWETWDLMIAQMDRTYLLELKMSYMAALETLKDSNVVWHGRLGQTELAQELAKSEFWLYPTQFLETSCIAAMEAQAAGCVGIVTSCGALTDTLGDRGLLMPKGYPANENYRHTFLSTITSLMADEEDVQKRKELFGEAQEQIQGLPHDVREDMGVLEQPDWEEMEGNLPRDSILMVKREAGIKYAREHFSWDLVAREWAEEISNHSHNGRDNGSGARYAGAAGAGEDDAGVHRDPAVAVPRG